MPATLAALSVGSVPGATASSSPSRRGPGGGAARRARHGEGKKGGQHNMQFVDSAFGMMARKHENSRRDASLDAIVSTFQISYPFDIQKHRVIFDHSSSQGSSEITN